MTQALDDYWDNYDACLDNLRTVLTVDELIRVCGEHYAKSVGDAFFPGGGDRDLLGTLMESNWSLVWCRADYYFAARDPEGNTITYVEGDIYRGTQKPIPECLCHREAGSNHELCCGHEDGRNPDCEIHGDGTRS